MTRELANGTCDRVGGCHCSTDDYQHNCGHFTFRFDGDHSKYAVAITFHGEDDKGQFQKIAIEFVAAPDTFWAERVAINRARKTAPAGVHDFRMLAYPVPESFK